jgi:hypothetical protein
MRHRTWSKLTWVTLAAAVAAAGCSTDATRTSNGAAQTNLSISQGSLPALASAALGFSADVADGPPGLIDPAHVDSLIVTVDSVEVLPDSLLAWQHRCRHWGPPGSDTDADAMGGGPTGPVGDGQHCDGQHHDGEHHDGPFGEGGMRDSLRLRDSTELRDSLGWGKLDEDWYRLTLLPAGSGHLDLMHLPTDTASGLQLAVGTVPAGSYGGARLFVSGAKIYFDTVITSRDSAVTFKPDTGYTVTFPSGEHSGIKTRAGFTILEGATDVVLIFDVGAMVRHAVALRDGRILIAPVLRGFGHRHHD